MNVQGPLSGGLQLQQGRCLGSRMPSRSSSSAGMRRGAPQRFSRRISALGDVKRSEGPIIKSVAMRFQLCLRLPLGGKSYFENAQVTI